MQIKFKFITPIYWIDEYDDNRYNNMWYLATKYRLNEKCQCSNGRTKRKYLLIEFILKVRHAQLFVFRVSRT